MDSKFSREHLFVVNPKSFRETLNLDSFVSDVKDYFNRVGQSYFIHISRFPRDAIRVIRKHMEQVGAGTIVRVYAVGGDGILFDCLNGIIGVENMELAAVPYGKSNDFVRTFGEGKTDLFRNIALQASSTTIPTDVIFCGNNYAMNTCTIGVESYTTHRAVELNTRWEGFYAKLPRKFARIMYNFAFFWGGILTSMSLDSVNHAYSVLIDGKDFSGDYAAINIANGPCYGGDKCAAIAAVPNDGLLDVMLVKSMNAVRLVYVMSRYIYGGYRQFPDDILYRRVTQISVRSEKPLVLQLDGELFFDTNITIRLLPSAVKIVAPGSTSYERRAMLDES
ncbi:hypothetical protein LQZ18_12260 [Lachnospiraceae bacterium ZAX-1]